MDEKLKELDNKIIDIKLRNQTPVILMSKNIMEELFDARIGIGCYNRKLVGTFKYMGVEIFEAYDSDILEVGIKQ